MTQTVKQWIARALVAAMVVVGMPVPVMAQITPTYTFSPNTVIQSAQVNANFNLLLNAVNRNGGTMLATLNTRSLIPTLTNTYDLGSSGLTFRDFYLGRNATIGGTLAVTGAATFGAVTITGLTCTGCISATQLASTTVTAAAYGGANSIATFTVDADGRLTAAANVTPQIPISTGVTGLGTDVAAALAVNVGSSGAFTTWGSSPTFGAVTVTTLDTGQGANELYDMDQNVLTTSSPTFVALGLTGAATITRAGIGTTGTDAVLATNTTAAANGAQQYSPRVNWTGQGWKTSGGPAASQAVSFIAELRPVQGSVIPTGLWVIASSQNGSAYTDRLTLDTVGALSVASLTLTGGFTNGVLSINGNTISSSHASTLAITPTAGQVITFDGTVTLDAGVIAGATSITSTEFTGGGAGITGITEANITDGTILARLAANETVSGKWIFSSTAADALNIAGAVSIGGQSVSIGAGDLSVARSATTAYLNFGTDATVNLERAASALKVNGASFAWGNPVGSAISSSSNVALLDAANVFTADQAITKANPTLTLTASAATNAFLILDGPSTYGAATKYKIGGTEEWAVGLGIGAPAADTFAWYNTPDTAVRMSLTSAGLLTVSGFGTHSFSAGGTGANSFGVANTTSGTGNQAYYSITAGTTVGYFGALSQGWTTAGYDIQSAVNLYADGVGGLSVAARNASGDIRLYSRNTLALTLGASQAATFAGNVDAPTFSAGGDSGYTGATCTAFTGGLCTTGSEPAAFLAAIGEGDLRPRLQALEAEVQQLRTMLRAQGQ